MKIGRQSFNALTYTLSIMSHDSFGGIIHIYDDNDFDLEKPKTFGINWSAIGTVGTKKTFEFADNLKKASEIAEYLNSLELVVDYSSDEEKNKKEYFEEMRDLWMSLLVK